MEEQNRAQFLAGIIAATVRNAFRGEGQAAVDPIDYVPDYARRLKKELASQETEEDMIAAMMEVLMPKQKQAN